MQIYFLNLCFLFLWQIAIFEPLITILFSADETLVHLLSTSDRRVPKGVLNMYVSYNEISEISSARVCVRYKS